MAVSEKDIEDLIKVIKANAESQTKLIDYFKNQGKSSTNKGDSGGSSSSGGGFSFSSNLDAGSSFIAKQQKNLTGANANLVGAVNTFADVISKIPIPGMDTMTGALTSSAGYIQDTANAFRALSKIGGGLSGDLAGLRSLLGRSNMELEPFVNIIGENKLALLGYKDGINGGAKVFANLIHEFEEGSNQFQQDFLAMGYTVEESREFIAKNLVTNQRRARIEGMTQGEMLKSSARLAKNLQTVSRFTGQQADQLQQDLQRRMTDGAVDAKMRKLENSGSKATREELEILQGTLSAIGPGFQDMFDEVFTAGTVVSDETQKLASVNGETYDLIAKSAHEFERGNVEMALMYADQAKKAGLAFAQSDEGLELAMRGKLGGVFATQAQQLEKVGPLINQIEAYMQQGQTGAKNIKAFMDAAGVAFEAAEKEVASRLDNKPLMKMVTDVEAQLGQMPGRFNEAFGQIFRVLEGYSQDIGDGLVSSIEGIGDVGEIFLNTIRPDSFLTNLEEIIRQKGEFKFYTSDEGDQGSEKTVTPELFKDLRNLIYAEAMPQNSDVNSFMTEEEKDKIYERLREAGITENRNMSQELLDAIKLAQKQSVVAAAEEQGNRTETQVADDKKKIADAAISDVESAVTSLFDMLGAEAVKPKWQELIQGWKDWNLKETFESTRQEILKDFEAIDFGNFVPDIFNTMSEEFKKSDVTAPQSFVPGIFDTILNSIKEYMPDLGKNMSNEGFVPAAYMGPSIEKLGTVNEQSESAAIRPSNESVGTVDEQSSFQKEISNRMDVTKFIKENGQEAFDKKINSLQSKLASNDYMAEVKTMTAEETDIKKADFSVEELGMKNLIAMIEQLITELKTTNTNSKMDTLVQLNQESLRINKDIAQNANNTNNYIRNLTGSFLV